MDVTVVEVVNGVAIYRTISQKSWDMMTPRMKDRFTIAEKAEPKKMPIPKEAIEMMEAAKLNKTEPNDNSEQENIEAVESVGAGVEKVKRTRQRRSV